MKKLLALLLAFGMLLCLCACGAKEEAPAEEEKPEAPVLAEATDTDLATEPVEASSGDVVVAPPAAAAAASDVDQDMFEQAIECIGLTPTDLIAAIGEPESTEYTSSCLEDNAEDGMLYYNEYGFYVWTLRYTDGTETIQDVLEM